MSDLDRLFLLLGSACLMVATPWRMHKWMYNKTPTEIYNAYRHGTAPPFYAWSGALQVLGMALLVLAFWRQWSGE